MTQDSSLKAQGQNLRPQNDLKILSDLIRTVSEFPRADVYRIIGDQLLRSGTSIGANIVEAKSSSSRKDFIRYFEISLKSCNETKYWLGLLRDSKLLEAKKIDKLLLQAISLGKILGSSLITLKGKRF